MEDWRFRLSQAENLSQLSQLCLHGVAICVFGSRSWRWQTESRKYIRYRCVFCVRVIVLLFQFEMCKLTWIFVLLSISQTTGQRKAWEGRRGKRAKPVDGHVSRRISWLSKWVTPMICMIWRERERERGRGNVRSRRVVGGTGGEGVGVGFGFFWGFCTRWQLSNFSTSRQIKFCIFMSQSRRVKSEIIRGTFCVVCVSLCVCVCLTLALNKSESHTNCILFGYHFCLCLSLCVSPRLSLSGNINLFI